MATASSIVVIAALVYSTHIVTDSVMASDCANLLKSCEMSGNVTANGTVSGQNNTFRNVDLILRAVEEAETRNECLSAIRKLRCIKEISACRNNTDLSQAPCMAINESCTEFVRKTYGGELCPQNDSYSNSSECVEITLASTGFCPRNETYKIAAGDIKEFLGNASVEKEKLRTAEAETNISAKCLAEYRKIKCETFVSTCTGAFNVTQESCGKKLQCLPSNITFVNKTRFCSNFPSEIPTTISTTTTQEVTTPYDLTRGFNTTVTTRLNTQFDSMYSNKSSSLYKSFARDIENGLKVAYKKIPGFQDVVVMELTCQTEVAVKHIVVTSSAPNVKVMEARLILANITGGYLEGKVVEANKMCVHANDHSDDHTDSTNWVYMIVFVCITALLLLAMVLCHQSK